MMALVRSEGDYFRDNRYVQVPGIDNLNQLAPGAIHTPDRTWNVITIPQARLFGRAPVRQAPRYGRRKAADWASTASSSWIFNS